MLEGYSNLTKGSSSSTFIPDNFLSIDYLEDDFVDGYVEELNKVYRRIAAEYQNRIRRDLASDEAWVEIAQDFAVRYSPEDNSFLLGFATTDEEAVNRIQYGGPTSPPNPKLTMLLVEADGDLQEMINRRPL